MTTTYRSRDQRIADEYTAGHGNCRKCGALTPHDVLASLGAQCGRCFDAYCAEGNVPNPPRTVAERKAVLRRLAGMAGGVNPNAAATVVQRLREIEASGRQLTSSQRWVLRCCEAKVAGRALPMAEEAAA